jgi:hypothetical protein
VRRRPTRLEIGLGGAALLILGGLSLWVFLCFQKVIRYPATFREVIEQEFQAQLAMLAEAARSERDLGPDERNAFDEAEILEAETWRYEDPTLRAGVLFKDSEKAKKRYSWLALFRSHPGKGRPGLNLWMTPEGDLIEYEQNVEIRGDHTFGYTVYFDADLLERRKAEYETR